MSTPDLAGADPHRVPAGASGALPLHLGVPETVRRSGAEASPGTPPWLAPPPRPATSGLRWDNRGGWRRSSSTTFGLTGRIVVTTLVLAFLAWLVVGDVLMAPLALPVVLWVLRDVWRPAQGSRPQPPTAPARPTRDAGRAGQSGVPE